MLRALARLGVVAAAHRRQDLYLVPDIATPFEQDGTRDGERISEWMHGTFVEELTRHGRPFVAVTGTRAERVAAALKAIRSLDGMNKNVGQD